MNLSAVSKFSLLLTALVVSLCLSEVFLRLTQFTSQKKLLLPANANFIFTPDSTIIYGIHGIKHFHTNSNGIRCLQDASPTDEKWICIGGSTTECNYLSDNETWINLLQDSINKHSTAKKIWIGNVGRSGHTSRENFIALDRFIPQHSYIKGVIIMVGLNDFLKRLSKDSLFENQFSFNKVSEDSLAAKIFLHHVRANEKTWIQHSELAFRLHHLYLQYFPETNAATQIDKSGQFYKLCRENRQSAAAIKDSLPDLKTALDEYERNLIAIIQSAKAQKLQLVFINQSALWKDSLNDLEQQMIWMGGIGNFQEEKGHAYYSPKALQTGLQLYNKKLKSVCDTYSIPLIDIASYLPRDTSVFYDDCHFHERGSKTVGKVIYAQWKNLFTKQN